MDIQNTNIVIFVHDIYHWNEIAKEAINGPLFGPSPKNCMLIPISSKTSITWNFNIYGCYFCLLYQSLNHSAPYWLHIDIHIIDTSIQTTHCHVNTADFIQRSSYHHHLYELTHFFIWLWHNIGPNPALDERSSPYAKLQW